jgi:Uma2 family endonuclease
MTKTIAPPVPRPSPVSPASALPGDFGERYQFTRAACEMLEEAGYIPERWELIEGELLVKVGQKDNHAKAIMLLVAYLLRAVGVDKARAQASMEIPGDEGERNVPEPDGMILKTANNENRYLTVADVETVLEICHTTETRDYSQKKPLYARCAIPEYWILDLNKRTLTVCRDPISDRGEWGSETELGENDAARNPRPRRRPAPLNFAA